MVLPTRTGKQGKPGKWESIFQSGIFDQTGKVREICPKYWKNKEILIGKLKKILEKSEKYDSQKM